MPGTDIKIPSPEGSFDCYLATPEAGTGPGLVLVSTIFGVDQDLRTMCDNLAAQGYVAMGPDFFWRGDKGPMPRTEEGIRRAENRAKPRQPLLESGTRDLEAVLGVLRRHPQCSGRTAVIGLCFGAPFAIIGPSRFGCDAGVSFHGSYLQNYLDEIARLTCPLSIHWGDLDYSAPPEVVEQVRKATANNPNAEIFIYPGIKHGYMSPTQWKSHVPEVAELTWRRAMKMLDRLKGPREAPARRAS